jgi:hypothetical protein
VCLGGGSALQRNLHITSPRLQPTLEKETRRKQILTKVGAHWSISCAIRGMGRRQQNVEDSAVSTPQQVVTPWEIYKRRKGVAASLFPVLVGGLLLPLTRPPSAASHPIRNSSAAPSDGPHAGIC